MRVHEIMSAQLPTISPSGTIVEAAMKMKESDSTSLLVTINDRLVGVLSDADILFGVVANGHDCREHRVWEFMASNLPVASPEMDLEELLRVMEEHSVRRLPVVSDNKVVGLISLADVASHLQIL